MVEVGGIAADRLRQFIERIERLEEERKDIADSIKGVYSEAKALGFNAKIMRDIVKLRKMDVTTAEERSSLLEVYAHAIGLDERLVALI